MWEAVAHRFVVANFFHSISQKLSGLRLRGQANVARLDIAENDDVAERFHVDEAHECPSFIL